MLAVVEAIVVDVTWVDSVDSVDSVDCAISGLWMISMDWMDCGGEANGNARTTGHGFDSLGHTVGEVTDGIAMVRGLSGLVLK